MGTVTTISKKSSKTPGKRPWRHVNIDPEDVKADCKQMGGPAVNELDGMTVPELKDYLALLANYEVETQEAKKRDDDLNHHKERVAELSAPYNDTLKDLRARKRYAVKLISDRS